jgi:hypothetical protein
MPYCPGSDVDAAKRRRSDADFFGSAIVHPFQLNQPVSPGSQNRATCYIVMLPGGKRNQAKRIIFLR